MKKLLYLLPLLLLGCNAQEARKEVEKSLPKAIIITLPTSQFDFIAKTSDGSIVYVRCNGVHPPITNTLFFGNE